MESEVKLELDRHVYRALLGRRRPGATATEQTNTFFDSRRRDLRRLRWALRLRQEPNRYLLTAKGAGVRHADGFYVRPELECEVSDAEAGRLLRGFRLADCSHPPCRELAAGVGDLFVQVTYSFVNYRTLIEYGKWHLDLDRTIIGDRVALELELEVPPDVVEEGRAALREWFAREGWPYRPSLKSKLARAEEWYSACGGIA